MAESDVLLVGTGQVEITPPVGAPLAGGLRPRKSEGVQDPLYAKAIVLESGGQRLAYVVLDLIALCRAEGDAGVALASQKTGIPEENIVWAATHTHTGPYTAPLYSNEQETVDREWLATIPSRFAQCVCDADNFKAPVHMIRASGYNLRVSQNRRVRLKDGREINVWNLANLSDDLQCVGAAGPVDPEIGILAFGDQGGKLVAVLFHFALHTNTNFGPCFSADYPAVVASRLAERFGAQVATLFVPGACGDLNTPGLTYRQVGDLLAEGIAARLAQFEPHAGPVRLGALKREVDVPFRDFSVDQEGRIQSSGWPPEAQEVFRREVEIMRAEGVTQAQTILQAWHIGQVAFVSLPGELFVEWGLKVKTESPFPWTYPVELGGDYLGYLVTRQAWEAGGYESLVATTAKPSVEGVAHMVETGLAMLTELHSHL